MLREAILVLILFVVCFILVKLLGLLAVFPYSVYRSHREDNKKIHRDLTDEVGNNEEIKKKSFKSWLSKCLYSWTRYQSICVGRIPSNGIRNYIYRKVFRAKITRRTVINGYVEIRSPWNLHADNCIIMTGCILDARQGIFIEDNVVFGTNVRIWTEQHDINDSNFRVTKESKGPVYIGKRAWICSDSTILPGVVVGEGTVLASKACATKDLEEFAVYAGIPAKKIGCRNQGLQYELDGKPGLYFI